MSPSEKRRCAPKGFPLVVGLTAGLLVLSNFAHAYPRPGRTGIVSVASDGTLGDNRSGFRSSVSEDGRYVAFRSFATNLVEGDSNGTEDIFVHDRKTGVTERVSVAPDGSDGNHRSFWPSMSTDGRYVAFQSYATNLVTGDANVAWDVFVHDRETGATERVSLAADGGEAHGASFSPSVSPDGRYVAFESWASNLVPGDTNEERDIFVHDRQTGANERVSVASNGAEGNGRSLIPSISGNGRVVAFESFASNLVPEDTNEERDIFAHDRETGTTQRVSVGRDGAEANHRSFQPSISADGRHIAFESRATNLVPWDNNETQDIFVHDRETEVIERVSVGSDGAEANGSSWPPSISPNGRYVGFSSLASNLVPGDSNEAEDVFVHDRDTGATHRVSMASDGTEGNKASVGPWVTADARHVVFDSTASTLVPGDTNDTWDVFVHDRGPSLGVGELVATPDGGRVSVSGWATFSGQPMAVAPDPPDDGGPGAEEAGAEFSGASLIYRPEQEDLFIRLRLTSLPPERCTVIESGGQHRVCEEGGGSEGVLAPGVLHRRTVYRIGFELEGVSYEVRARTGSAIRARTSELPDTAIKESDDPYFGLYRCDPDCNEETPLTGGIGTTGSEVRISVPLSALGASEGTAVSQLRASSSKEERGLEAEETIDEVDLSGATVPVAKVSLGIAPVRTPEEQVAFDFEADLADGDFSGVLDVSSLPSGDYDVWARSCLATTCGAASVPVTIGAAFEKKDTSLELSVEGRGQDMILKARLTELDAPQSPIVGRTIDFYSDSELIGSDETDSDGVATVPVPPAHRGANRTYEAVFEGDDLYGASSDDRPGRGGAQDDGAASARQPGPA